MSLFLANDRIASLDPERDEAFAFQAEIEVRNTAPFVPRPDPREFSGDDGDSLSDADRERPASTVARGTAAAVPSAALAHLWFGRAGPETLHLRVRTPSLCPTRPCKMTDMARKWESAGFPDTPEGTARAATLEAE